MRTIKIKVYKFNELPDAAKEKAISHFREINVAYEWWESTYEDAKEIGLQINSFDLDQNRHATGKFIFSAKDVAQAILENHGEHCKTYKTAESFIKDYLPKWEENNELEYRDYDLEYELEEMEDKFLESLLEEYSIMLQNEFEYLQEDEQVIETIEANDYEFNKDGSIF